MHKNLIFTLIFATLLLALPANASIKLKIAAVNPSGTNPKTTSVKYDLPKGVEPDNIIDMGDMELGYDFERDTYYVFRKITLAPAEKKVLIIELEDIWIVAEDDIEFYKNHTAGLTDRLVETKHVDIGDELSEAIHKELDKISKDQNAPALSAREKMNMYYEHMGALKEIKTNIGMLENLVLDVGGVVEERVQVPETLAVSIPADRGPGPWKTLEMTVKISNPSETNSQIARVKYSLPIEVTPSAVLDNGGLELAYDFNKECYYAFKNDIPLEPQEGKEYLLTIKDIWRVPETELESLQAHTQNLMLLLGGTEYYSQGAAIADKVFYNLEEIDTTQNMKVPPPEHIAFYRDNVKTFKEVKKYIAHLEKIVNKAGAAPGITVAKAEVEKGGGEELKKVRGYEGVTFIAKSIFRGKAPTVATTWKIIFIIMAFVGLMSIVFLMIWRRQLKR